MSRLPKGWAVLCEGEKDADRLWSFDLPATTHAGGATSFQAHGEDYIGQLRWAGVTTLVLCPDHDQPGYALMADVATQALRAGLAVRWLALPGLTDKQDVSNWLDAGHSPEELAVAIQVAPLVTAETRAAISTFPESNPEPDLAGVDPGPPPNGPAPPPAAYSIDKGRLCRAKYSRGVLTGWDPLANFSARIVEELAYDDGAELRTAVRIQGSIAATGTVLPEVRVPASRFGGLAWVLESWGSRAILHAGQGIKEHVRAAIQTVSLDAPRRILATHTGWRRSGDAWGYCSSSGALGLPGLEVELEGHLTIYRLPLEAECPVDAFRVSLALWELGPLALMLPLWSTMFRAPLSEALPVDYTLWIEGPSGTLKTTVAKLFLSHFGPFDEHHTLPASWQDTANALERTAYLVKDAPLLVDDFVREQEDADRKATRVLRSQGNLVGRGRMTRDLTASPSYPPRGVLVVTAEHRPAGVSLSARMLVLQFAQGLIREKALTAAQATQGRLSHAMAGYLAWLAPQMGDADFRARVRSVFREARSRARAAGTDLLRVPEVVAHLWVGVATALEYGRQVGALTPEQAQARAESAWAALTVARQAQEAEVEGHRETRVFLDVLWSAIRSGRVEVLDRSESGGAGGRADRVGWRDITYYLLDPTMATQAVNRVLRDNGQLLRLEVATLGRHLVQDGLVEPGEGGRPRRQMRVAGDPIRVWALVREKVAAFTGETGWLGRQAPDAGPDPSDDAQEPPAEPVAGQAEIPF